MEQEHRILLLCFYEPNSLQHVFKFNRAYWHVEKLSLDPAVRINALLLLIRNQLSLLKLCFHTLADAQRLSELCAQ